MNNKKAWLLSISLATMVAANGLVMAATAPQDQQNAPKSKTQQTPQKGEVGRKGGMQGFQRGNKELLTFLKIDENTFHAAMKEGKTLADIAKTQGISEEKLKAFLVDQMTKRMDEAAKAGKISDDKKAQFRQDIEKRVSDMINGKAPMRGPGQWGHAPFANAKLLDLLQVDEQTLKTEMSAGKTLATIAGEHGVSEEVLKSFFVQYMTQRIDEGVASGKIPADKAADMKANLDQRVSDMINGKGPMGGHGPMMGNHGPRGHMWDQAKLLQLLNTDEAALRADLQAGKTLAAIAEEHGVSEQALKDFCVQNMNQRIDEGVASGKIPADKAAEMKSNLEQRVSDMIHHTGPMKGHRQRPEAAK